jgi:hypothetical protein
VTEKAVTQDKQQTDDEADALQAELGCKELSRVTPRGGEETGQQQYGSAQHSDAQPARIAGASVGGEKDQ